VVVDHRRPQRPQRFHVGDTASPYLDFFRPHQDSSPARLMVDTLPQPGSRLSTGPAGAGTMPRRSGRMCLRPGDDVEWR
jgi:hypothetical protein